MCAPRRAWQCIQHHRWISPDSQILCQRSKEPCPFPKLTSEGMLTCCFASKAYVTAAPRPGRQEAAIRRYEPSQSWPRTCGLFQSVRTGRFHLGRHPGGLLLLGNRLPSYRDVADSVGGFGRSVSSFSAALLEMSYSSIPMDRLRTRSSPPLSSSRSENRFLAG